MLRHKIRVECRHPREVVPISALSTQAKTTTGTNAPVRKGLVTKPSSSACIETLSGGDLGGTRTLNYGYCARDLWWWACTRTWACTRH
jgi:hypothetical protein